MKTPGRPIISAIQFEEGVVVIQYVDPKNLKANGAQQHSTLFVPRDDDYDDEIEALEEAAQYLLADISEDWPNLKSVASVKRRDPDEDDDEED